MNLTIISRSIQNVPSVTWWIFEVSLADYNSFLNAYASSLPNPFVFVLQSSTGNSITINSQINSQYQWIPAQNGSQNFIRIAWTDPNNLPTFNINTVTISYGAASNPNPVTPNIVITYQAGVDSLNVAYRPIIFRCTATITGATPTNYIPPVVYCDIYLNGIYYKSLGKTQYINNNGITPEYEFDIQDALQEVMSYNLPDIDGSAILDVNKTFKKVFIKFRNAKLDANGFITSEQLVPIQGTSSNIPVAGDGIQSNEIYVYNATLQHEDEQDFQTFLDNYKTGIWNGNSFPLTRRPKKMKLCKTDSSYFPIISSSQIACIELNYRNKNSNTFQTAQYCYPIPVTPVLTILNVVNNGGVQNYDIYFSWNFPLTNVYSEVSSDGINWSTPILLAGTTSPRNRVISLGGSNFYVRLSNVDPNNGTIYSNIYHYVGSGSGSIVTMPSTQQTSISKTLAQVNAQATGSQTIPESIVYNGYQSSSGIAYGDIRITSLPNRGTLTVHGWNVVVPFVCPLSEIQQGNMEFWPTGSNGSQPFSSYTTSFQYVVIDINGNESAPVTMNINFNAI